MKFSIIIPVYNTENYLSACIESILRQRFSDFELLLIDDGSTDSSLAICDDYAKKDNRIKVFNQANCGASLARNLGLRHAVGEYVTFIDSDDAIDPQTLDICMANIERHQAELLIFSMRHYIAGKNSISEKEFILEDKFYPDIHNFLSALIQRGGMLIYSAGNKIYKKEILDSYQIRFDAGLSFGEDRIFNYTYLKHCHNAVTISAVLYFYYVRKKDSLSNRYRNSFFNDVVLLHLAKKELFDYYNFDGNSYQKFIANDLYHEIINAIHHILSQWRALSVRERYRVFHEIATADYPSYIHEFRSEKLEIWILQFLITHRQVFPLYVLLWLKFLMLSDLRK